MIAIDKLSRIIAAIGLLIYSIFQLSQYFFGWPESVFITKLIGSILIVTAFLLHFVYHSQTKDKRVVKLSLLYLGSLIAIFLIFFFSAQ